MGVDEGVALVDAAGLQEIGAFHGAGTWGVGDEVAGLGYGLAVLLAWVWSQREEVRSLDL